MSKNLNLEDAVFELQMLTETFIVLEEAVEYSESELPEHYLFIPVRELKSLCDKFHNILFE